MSGWLGDSNGPMGDHGAFMEPELRLPRAELAGQIRALGDGRLLIAIVGAPGSGKSTIAHALAAELNALEDGSAAIVAMDGFHLPNAALDQAGLRNIKGAPETFDVEGLSSLLSALKSAAQDCRVPTFDRDLDAVVEGGATVPAKARYLLVEGNYLLLTRAPWRDLYPLFDLSIRIDVPPEELRRRLTARWQGQNLPPEEVRRRVEENDMPNGLVTVRENRGADFVIRD